MESSSTRPRSIRLDTLATVVFIVACAAGTTWIVRDLLAGPARVAATSRVPPPGARTPPRPTTPPPIPAEPISLEGALRKGNAQAPVALVIYSDFQCPYCGRFAQDTWPSLDTKYVRSGKVQVAFRHFPLETIHPFALGAAEAAECAGQQGQFWPMHDLLFANQKSLATSDLSAYAERLKLTGPAFQSCLSGATAAKVRSDAATGAAIGVTGTPAFLIGRLHADGRVRVLDRLSGARPLADFERPLDKALATIAGK
jgi:protein-disulfide isomerase